MVKHIEDIAIDKSKEYRKSYIKSRIRHFFRTLFPIYYNWRLEREIDKYNKKYPDERQEL